MTNSHGTSWTPFYMYDLLHRRENIHFTAVVGLAHELKWDFSAEGPLRASLRYTCTTPWPHSMASLHDLARSPPLCLPGSSLGIEGEAVDVAEWSGEVCEMRAGERVQLNVATLTDPESYSFSDSNSATTARFGDNVEAASPTALLQSPTATHLDYLYKHSFEDMPGRVAVLASADAGYNQADPLEGGTLGADGSDERPSWWVSVGRPSMFPFDWFLMHLVAVPLHPTSPHPTPLHPTPPQATRVRIVKRGGAAWTST